MNGKMYLPLLLRRALKKYPSILAMTVLMLFVTLLAAVLILAPKKDSTDTKKVSVGVVGNTKDTFFNIGIDVIKSLDDSRFYIDIISMSKDEADAALQNGDIIGYVDVPENFIDGIASMENVPAVYYLPNRPESLGTALTKEVMDNVAMYITESQKVVAGLSSFIYDNGLQYGKSLDEISIKLMTNAILPRNSLYSTEYTGISDSVSTGGYYICGLLLFFLMLWGISCASLLIRKDNGIQRILFSKGFGSTYGLMCEYAVYLILTLVTFIIIALIAGTILPHTHTDIPELYDVKMRDTLLFVIKIFPVMLALCSMHIFIYEAVHGTVASLLTQFLVSVILGYISGCFYPSSFFPQALRNAADLLPSGAAFEYMRKAMISSRSPRAFAILMIYTAVFLALAIMIRKHRSAGDGR